MTIIMYHKKCFKYDDSNKKKLYKMFVNIMCNMQACDKFSENFPNDISRCAYQLCVAYSPQTAIQTIQ